MSTQNYGTVSQEPAKHEHHDHEGEHFHHHGGDRDPNGFPKETSVWSALPTWVLLVVQYLMGLGIAMAFAGATALFWGVAAIYFYKVSEGTKFVQHILAILVFIVCLIVSPFAYMVLSLIALVLWVIWIIQDITAVVKNEARPKIITPYFLGLFTYAN